MNKVPRVVLAATDLSRAAFAAVRRAALLARAHGARLELVHVISQSFAAATWSDVRAAVTMIESDIRRLTEENLAALADQVESEIGVRASTAIVQGRPYLEIARHAAAIEAEVVVVGAHGENFLLTPFLGTTAHRVLRELAMPVLLVKHTPVADRAPAAQYRRILVATDFSEDALGAARCARRLFPDAKFALFHAYEVPFETRLAVTVPESALQQYRDLAAERAALDMHAFALASDLEHSARIVRHGPAALRAREHARDFDADLLVLGAAARPGLQSVLLGSVSLHLVTEAQCDVLLARAARATARDHA